MKSPTAIKTSFFLLVLLLALSCIKQEKIVLKGVIDLDAGMANRMLITDTITLSKLIDKEATDSFQVYINANKIPVKQGWFALADYCQTGAQIIRVVGFKNGKKAIRQKSFIVYAKKKPLLFSYAVTDSLIFYASCFTQGLVATNTHLVYSCGQPFQSKVGQIAFTGGMDKEVYNLADSRLFAEGITRVGNYYILLSWQDQVILIFDESFNRVKDIPFPSQIQEGWGITNTNDTVFISDGTSIIKSFWFSPNLTLEFVRQFHVSSYRANLNRINELEMVNGHIAANSWGSDVVYFIDPRSGEVTHRLDLATLAKPFKEKGVLNGIASKDEAFFVTGKNWGKIYQLRLSN